MKMYQPQIGGYRCGTGQGGGASPIEWFVLLLVMLKTFQSFAKGSRIIDPTDKHTILLYILSYVGGL